jgi:hypothetical protein
MTGDRSRQVRNITEGYISIEEYCPERMNIGNKGGKKLK